MPCSTNKFAGKFCPQPFSMMSVYDDGSLYFCCPALLGIPPGNLREQSLDEAWNSPWAQRIRKTILDGSYTYCSEVNCPRLQPGSDILFDNDTVDDPFYRRVIDEQLTELPQGPRHISVAYDPTCNLSCPSCRTELYRCGTDEREEIRKIHNHIYGGGLENLRLITMATNGDPFASPFYLSTLREFDWAAHPQLKIEFITNGLRLTPKMWDSVANCHGAIESLRVSVNAARPETFAINQRGGDFDELMQNLEHLSKLRRAGAFPCFILSYYVLENNFREMKEFVALGKRLGVDQILFHHYLKSSSVSESAFEACSVHLPTHPLHDELKAILDDPIFDDPSIRLSNLRFMRGDYDPQEINAAGKFAPDKHIRPNMTWEECRDFLMLPEPIATKFRNGVNALKRDIATILTRPPADGGPSPIEALLGAPTPHGSPDEACAHILQTALIADDDRTYAQAMSQVNARYLPRFVGLLPVQLRGALAALPVHSFFDVITDYDAMGEAVALVNARRGTGPV